jgi:glycosyltransferase involved in cell wall biosynthesis
MSQPYFSIILPTRNRGALLRRALQSTLWQTFDDFEVLVFDNASEDDTPSVVKEFSDPRIRYVRAETRVNGQGGQASYEAAFRAASGTFFHAIGDDDALLPHCLEKAKSVIDRHNAHLLCFATKCFYHYPDWYDETIQNTLLMSHFTGAETVLSAKTELASIFDLRFNTLRHPNVTNSFFRKSDVDALMAKHGSILLDEQMGDISIAVFLLNSLDNYVMLDEPLQVAGSSGRSNAANQAAVMERSLEAISDEMRMWFADKSKVLKYLDGVPVKMPLWSNFQIATMLRQKAMLGLPFEIDWVSYFKKMWRALARLEARGIDVTRYKEDFFYALSGQNFSVRLQANFYLRTRRKKRAKPRTFVRKNESLVRGAAAEFSDILGATKYAYEKYFDSRSFAS